MSMSDGYPFVLGMVEQGGSYHLSVQTFQYRFKSARSNHTYIVRAEQFPEHTYCLKFYDKAHRHSDNKFSLLTNTFEPRTIFYTLYHIMLDVLQRDPSASFFFIGAADEYDEIGTATRRYRIYRRFTSSIVGENLFEHFRVNDTSLYILVNKNAVVEPEALAKQITAEVRSAFANEHS